MSSPTPSPLEPSSTPPEVPYGAPLEPGGPSTSSGVTATSAKSVGQRLLGVGIRIGIALLLRVLFRAIFRG